MVDSPRPALTARRAAFLVLRRIETLQSEDEQLVQHLAQQAELVGAIRLAQDFAQLVRQRQSEQFDPCLEQAEQSQLAPFERFARSLREDYDAVKAGKSYNLGITTNFGRTESACSKKRFISLRNY